VTAPLAQTARRFRYRAATSEGRVVEGVVDTPSRDGAIGELRRRQLFVIALDEEQVARARAVRTWGGGDRTVVLALWTRTLATMLSAGVPLDDALGFGAEQSDGSTFAGAAQDVHDRIRGGSSLASALRSHPARFDALYVAMVAAGEEGGALPHVLERLADHLEESAELRSTVRAMLVYPALLTVVSGAGIALLLLFVLPRFTAMLADVGGTLPVSTRLLIGVSHVVTAWWWLWLPILLVLSVQGRRVAREVAWQERRLAWPVIGPLERAWSTARFTRTLSILLRSGVPILSALRIARTSIGNAALALRAEHAESAVSEGARLSDALSGVLPALATRLIAAGEESGRVAELCEGIAETYDGEVRRATRALVGLVEPALVLFFGALIGWVALAMLQAIYSVNARAF